jgi:hypothetical protein
MAGAAKQSDQIGRIFTQLGDCLLWAVFLKMTFINSPNFCAVFPTKKVLQKMGKPTFWAIF